MTSSPLATRVFTVVLAFVVGAGIGFVLTFTHRQYIADVGGIEVPLGLLGGLAIVAALYAGMRLAFGERTSPMAAAAGVLLSTAVLSLPRNGGSSLVLDDPIGYTWALGPTVIAIVVIGWPARRRKVRTA